MNPGFSSSAVPMRQPITVTFEKKCQKSIYSLQATSEEPPQIQIDSQRGKGQDVSPSEVKDQATSLSTSPPPFITASASLVSAFKCPDSTGHISECNDTNGWKTKRRSVRGHAACLTTSRTRPATAPLVPARGMGRCGKGEGGWSAVVGACACAWRGGWGGWWSGQRFA